MMLFVNASRLETLLGLVLSPLFWALVLSALAVSKGIRSGNVTRYFGNPIAVLPRRWQNWVLDLRVQQDPK